jgi:hypothetical protein
MKDGTFTYEDFCGVLNTIKKYKDFIDAIYEVAHVDVFECEPVQNLEDELFNTLEKIIGDEESQWISYWVYELDFGKKYHPGTVTVEGENIPFKTVEDLWIFLNEV